MLEYSDQCEKCLGLTYKTHDLDVHGDFIQGHTSEKPNIMLKFCALVTEYDIGSHSRMSDIAVKEMGLYALLYHVNDSLPMCSPFKWFVLIENA